MSDVCTVPCETDWHTAVLGIVQSNISLQKDHGHVKILAVYIKSKSSENNNLQAGWDENASQMWWLYDITYVGTRDLIWDILKSDENEILLYVGTSNVFQWSTNPHCELVDPHAESYIRKSLRSYKS